MKQLSYKRILIYLCGMVILACGLTMNTKVTLGVSPILSIPYAISEVFSLNFGNLVFIYYCIFIAIQLLLHYFVIHEKDKSIYISDVLQIVLSMAFTRIMNVVSLIIPVFEKECTGFCGSGRPSCLGRCPWTGKGSAPRREAPAQRVHWRAPMC